MYPITYHRQQYGLAVLLSVNSKFLFYPIFVKFVIQISYFKLSSSRYHCKN